MKDLEKQIEELVSCRNNDVSKALAQQSEEVDFLKAELTSTKVRLHDALSHSQAEKDALIRHADASRAELLQQLEKIRSEYRPVDDTESQSSVMRNSVEALCNEHMPEVEAIIHNADNSANLWKKLELLRELVKAEKEKWNLQQTDSEQVNANMAPDVIVHEAAHSHKIRSSWVVLEEQVLPLIENFCTTVDQGNEPINSEAVENRGYVVENQENGTLTSDADGKISEQQETLLSVRGEEVEERQEIICLKEVINKMQDSIHVKDEAVHEMETKCNELQVELDSVSEQLRSQEKLTENLSTSVESVNEQLNHRTAELSDKNTNVEKLNAEIAELKEQVTEKLLVLQADCDEKMDSERKTWQAQIATKTDELLAKCAELEQHELTIKTLSDQCSMLTAERDAKTAEIADSKVEIDSLTREISVVKQQLNDRAAELHEAQTHVEHERKLLKDERECETLVLTSKNTVLEDEIRTLQQQLESKSIELVSKDEALTVIENRNVSEREEFQAKIVGLEGQLSSDQKLSVEQLDVLREEVKMKVSAIREHEETHAAYCKLTDTKVSELSAAVSAQKDEIKSLLEHHKAELLEQRETFDEEMTKLNSTNEEQLAYLNSQIGELARNKHDLESELQSLTDKLVCESESVARLEKEITELSLVKEECERQVEDLHCTVTSEMEHMIELRNEEITALKSALADKDHSLSLLHAALSQTCREDIQSVDSSSHTVVDSSDDHGKDAKVSDAGSGDAGRDAVELSGEQNYDVQMMVHQISSLGAVNTMLREKIGRLEADVTQIKQTPVDETPELASLHCPPTASHSTGLLHFILYFYKTSNSMISGDASTTLLTFLICNFVVEKNSMVFVFIRYTIYVKYEFLVLHKCDIYCCFTTFFLD